MRFATSTSALALVVLAVGALEAQDPQRTVVVGEVVDQSTGEPLSAVHFIFRAQSRDEVVWEGVSDRSGEFRTDPIREGSYAVSAEALGFHSLSHPVELAGAAATELTIELAPAALELEPIVVVARRSSRLERRGFYQRRAAGWGHTMTRDEIEERHPARVTDLFYAIPGARVVRSVGAGSEIQSNIRLRRNCVPTVLLDGVQIPGAVRLDDLLAVDGLEALEVYHGTANPVTAPQNTCGTVLAWTRQGQIPDAGPWSWPRVLGAVGILGLVILTTR